MKPGDHKLPNMLERQWRAWAHTEPEIDETQLRRTLLERTADCRPEHPPRLILTAAAMASVIAVVLGLEMLRTPPPAREEPALVHPVDENVVLFITGERSPVYVVLAPPPAGEGEYR